VPFRLKFSEGSACYHGVLRKGNNWSEGGYNGAKEEDKGGGEFEFGLENRLIRGGGLTNEKGKLKTSVGWANFSAHGRLQPMEPLLGIFSMTSQEDLFGVNSLRLDFTSATGLKAHGKNSDVLYGRNRLIEEKL